jgi:hypothetical protein
MPHTLTHRPLLPLEATSLRRSVRMTADNWAWVGTPVISFGFGAYLIGKLLTRVLPLEHLPQILAIVGAALGIVPSLWVYRSFALGRARVLKDVLETGVEVFDVEDPVVVTQEEYNDEGPIYYLDIGDNKVLFLWGQWVYDPHVFPDSAWHSGNEEDEGAFPFPSSRFRLHRAPCSGRVLRLELLGTPVKPIKVLKRQEILLSGLRESELLEGSLNELSAAIARVSERSPTPADA